MSVAKKVYCDAPVNIIDGFKEVIDKYIVIVGDNEYEVPKLIVKSILRYGLCFKRGCKVMVNNNHCCEA